MKTRAALLGGVCLLLACGGEMGTDIFGMDGAAVKGNTGNCTLVVPANALTAQGLASPYHLVRCTETNPNTQAFVEATILDPATGQLSVYHPLVVDQGQAPAVAPVVPTLPPNAVVGIWFGFDGNILSLLGASGPSTLAASNCVNGLGGSDFGQFAHCNGVQFFAAAKRALASGLIQVPALGTASDGLACPTVRAFDVVDQDQSDNVVTRYLVTANGLAQSTAANLAKFPKATVAKNASDNGLASVLDAALGCSPFKVPDLDDPGANVTSLALDELLATVRQAAPIAQIPIRDPMTLVGDEESLDKTNAYRTAVGQSPYTSLSQADQDQLTYCNNLLAKGPSRMKLDQTITSALPSPVPEAANTLFTFLAQRFNFAWGADGLNCAALTGRATPITTVQDANGVTTKATINL